MSEDEERDNAQTSPSHYNRDPHKAEYIERFEMDHLLSLTGLPDVIMDPNDGLYKLKQKENEQGVVTLRCILALVVRHNRKEIIVKNCQSGEEMESFPLNIVSTIFFRRSLDPRETYNNKVIIVLSQSPRNAKEIIPEMHIFQSIKTPADEVVERLNDFKVMKLSPKDYPPLPESELHLNEHTTKGLAATPTPFTIAQNPQQFFTAGGTGYGAIAVRGSIIVPDKNGSTAHGKLEREIYLINRCFDDIERFFSKVQKLVKVYLELNQKMSRSARGTKKGKKTISNTLALHAQLPTEAEFMECFKMAKLALNLLARLDRSHSTPNKVDSTHSLFATLEVVANASRNPQTKALDIAQRVSSPLLSAKAVAFLKEILIPQEQAFWKELGPAWTTPREYWRGQFVPSYLPVFSDGFTPTLWDYDEDIFAPNSALPDSNTPQVEVPYDLSAQGSAKVYF